MPDFSIEKKLNCDGLVFGLDEAGRGPWCGPVVAACVCFDKRFYENGITFCQITAEDCNDPSITGVEGISSPQTAPDDDTAAFIEEETARAEVSYLLRELNDSKKLSAKKREKLYPLIFRHAIVGIGQASAAEIDDLNILQASFLAMRRALDSVIEKGCTPAYALIDGNRLPKGWREPCSCVVKGDGLSLSIAAASVVAKVTRDRLMQLLAREFPAYGWERNAGYGTHDHMAALHENGVTVHHRKSYAPIKKLLEMAQDAA